MSHYDDTLRNNGPYPVDKVMRIWLDGNPTPETIHVILTSSGWDRFSVQPEHKDYAHYKDILTNYSSPTGWVSPLGRP